MATNQSTSSSSHQQQQQQQQGGASFSLITFGEAMLRICPESEGDYFTTAHNRASGLSHSLLTVGGDEMNVAIALSKVGIQSEWVSVLPDGVLADIVVKSCERASVLLKHLVRVPSSSVGLFFVLPEEKRVEYQRQHSAWAFQKPNSFDWTAVYDSLPRPWLHATGISPMTGDGPADNWKRMMETAAKRGMKITMDFNHRKQLGPLDKLWSMTVPFLSALDLLILSVDSMKGLAQLLGIAIPPNSSSKDLLLQLHNKLSVRLAYCDKVRESKLVDGNIVDVQRRFSVIAHQSQLISTEEYPVLHVVKDECGGGSAWAAGYIYGRNEFSDDWKKVLRRADLLAALCQESVGDHSTVTKEQLIGAEIHFQGKIADISSQQTLQSIFQGASKDQILTNIVHGLQSVSIVPILRAKNPELTIARCKELIDMGANALEITLDTPDILNIVRETRKYLDSKKKKSFLGIGTVIQKDQLLPFVGLIDFAISPVNPTGFIDECHRNSILAIPGASSPQELWNTKLQGAQIVKLFPSQLWSPAALKEVLNVGPLGDLKVMATGGITPEKYREWLEAGAIAVGMGSRLCGNDIKYNSTDPQFEAEHHNWNTKGKLVAQKLFADCNKS